MNNPPIVAIVGRMNVGKSTLFNRLSTSVKSLTLDYAGVTRDIMRDTIQWNERTFELVDTGGISLKKAKDIITEKVRQQAWDIVAKADIVLLVIDGSIGLTKEDDEVASYIRKQNKHVIIVVNKADKKNATENSQDAYTLGYKNIVFISAEHGIGINDLLDLIIDFLPKKTATQEDASYRVMLLGRPNVGKSSLMNALLNYERSIVADIPGTTREAITESVKFYKENIAITDTPGIRRKKTIKTQIENMMVHSAFDALKESHLILLLLDATEGGFVDQDLKLAFYAFSEQHKSLIILINKWDLATEEHRKEIESNFELYQHLLKKVPVLKISCKDGKNIGQVLPLIDQVWHDTNYQWQHGDLNALFLPELAKRPLMHTGYQLKVFKAYQIRKAPITICLEVNHPEWFGPSELGFFENLIRRTYKLPGVPIKFITKKNE